MPKFGPTSEMMLSTCHPDLQRVLREAIKHVDFTVMCGHRTKEAQNEAVRLGNSKTPWPTSKHNAMPSLAVDVAPYPIDWHEEERFIYLAGIIKGIATQMGIEIRWGGDWDSDLWIREEKLKDFPHIELVQRSGAV